MKILNFGSCNIDYVYTLDHIAALGETVNCSKRETFSGGKGLNQSVAASKAGAKVFHAGATGHGGEFLRKLLSDSSVDITYLKNTDTINGHAIIQVDSDGHNSIVIYAGANGCVTKDYIDSVLENFSAGDILLCQNEISSVPYLIDAAYRKGLITVFNPSPINREIKKTDFSKTEYLCINEKEAECISGKKCEEDFISFMRNTYPNLKVIFTKGEKGSVYFDADRIIAQKAYTVPVVDTTAAGDTFLGYFAAGLYFGKAIEETLKYASAAAAIAVSKSGAAPSVPGKEEVEAFLNKQ